MKTNYEIRYAAHPEDAKGYDTQSCLLYTSDAADEL